jgi:hypothetical protein
MHQPYSALQNIDLIYRALASYHVTQSQPLDLDLLSNHMIQAVRGRSLRSDTFDHHLCTVRQPVKKNPSLLADSLFAMHESVPL